MHSIPTREATEQLRNVLGQGNQLSHLGYDAAGSYEAHFKELARLGTEAIKHGADQSRVQKELDQHTTVDDAGRGTINPTFGSPEHLAEAQKYHDMADIHTADYSTLFDRGSQKAMDAWGI